MYQYNVQLRLFPVQPVYVQFQHVFPECLIHGQTVLK